MFFFRPYLYKRSLQGLRSFASTASEFRIPVIDFSKFRAAKSDIEKKNTANEIVSAFKDSGFIYVSNHGIPQGEQSFTMLESSYQLSTSLETLSHVFQKVPFHAVVSTGPNSFS